MTTPRDLKRAYAHLRKLDEASLAELRKHHDSQSWETDYWQPAHGAPRDHIVRRLWWRYLLDHGGLPGMQGDDLAKRAHDELIRSWASEPTPEEDALRAVTTADPSRTPRHQVRTALALMGIGGIKKDSNARKMLARIQGVIKRRRGWNEHPS